MNWPTAIIGAILCAVCLAAFLHAMLAAAFAAQWRKETPDVEPRDDALPPLTLLRPVKSGIANLREKLTELARAMRAGDHLVLGVNDGSPDVEIAESVRAEFAERKIAVVRCHPDAALNPKISKLRQMETAADGEHLVVSDSEAQIDGAWLDAFRREWAASGADAITCGYRFADAASWPQLLDAAHALLSLWPGLLFVRRFGRMNFTLGACTGLRRSDLTDAGGWTAFADDLAEDNRLGAALAKAGRTIRLSRQVATLESDRLTWRDYWRHQRRVAVTYRVCNPAGFAGMIIPRLMWAAVLLIAFPPFDGEANIYWIEMWALVLCSRWVAIRALATAIEFPTPKIFPVMLVSDAVETACWLLAWFSPRVWWAGKWWRISREGKLREG